MKAFCVNIPSETERRLHCEAQYKKAGIEYEFVPAIDGRIEIIGPPCAMDEQESNRWTQIHTEANRFSFLQDNMSSPARACAMSHALAWKKAAQQAKEDGLHHMVNEDDFKLGNLNDLESTLNEAARSPFDIIYLGYRGGESMNSSASKWAQKQWHRIKYATSEKSIQHKLRRNYVLNRTPQRIRGFQCLLRAGMTWGGHAYIMNARGAEALIESNRSLRFLPDEALRWVILEGKVKVGMSRTKHFICEDFGSAIRSREEHNDHHRRYPST